MNKLKTSYHASLECLLGPPRGVDRRRRLVVRAGASAPSACSAVLPRELAPEEDRGRVAAELHPARKAPASTTRLAAGKQVEAVLAGVPGQGRPPAATSSAMPRFGNSSFNSGGGNAVLSDEATAR